MQRYRFYNRFRQPDESVPAFVAELKHLAKDCDFGAALEDNLLVCGISDRSLQKILLSEQKLTFKRAFELAQSHESAAKDMSMLQTSSSQEVHKLKDSPSQCYSCGQLSHRQNQCKFRNSTCFYCGKRGHIQTVCRSRKSSNSSSSTSSQPRSKSESTSSSYTRHRSSRPSRNRSNQLPPSDIESIPKEPEGEYTLFNVTSNSQPPLYVSLIVNNVSLTMGVDTGASFSVISKQTYDKSFASYPLQKTSVKLKTYSGESLTMYGEFVPSIQYQDQKTELPLVVAGNDGPSLLGRNWLHSIHLDWNSLFHLADH